MWHRLSRHRKARKIYKHLCSKCLYISGRSSIVLVFTRSFRIFSNIINFYMKTWSIKNTIFLEERHLRYFLHLFLNFDFCVSRLLRYEEINEMLRQFLELSNNTQSMLLENYIAHTKTLIELKKDLEISFRRIRYVMIQINSILVLLGSK